jgi:hypothetical protein
MPRRQEAAPRPPRGVFCLAWRALAHADATVAHVRPGIDPGGACRLLRSELAVPGVLALIPTSAAAVTVVAVPAVTAMNHSLVSHEVLIHVPPAHASIVGLPQTRRRRPFCPRYSRPQQRSGHLHRPSSSAAMRGAYGRRSVAHFRLASAAWIMQERGRLRPARTVVF